MARACCPMPLVEEALLPYTRSRQEVQEIRNTTAAYLTSCTSATSHLDLVVPFANSPTNYPTDIPPSIYRRYLDALSAHQQAKEKYNALRTELDDLRQQPPTETEQPAERIPASLQEHVDLLRSRQMHRKLTILSETVDKLQSSPANPAQIELKAHLRSQLGEPPDPPQATPGTDQNGSPIDLLVNNLKKSLILAHGQLQETERSRTEVAELAKDLADPGLDVRVAALQGTRDRLIQWVEEELGKVSEDESVLEDEELDEYINGGHAQSVAGQVDEEVQSLYRCYTDSRATLLQHVQSVREEAAQQRLKRTTIINQSSPNRSRRHPSQSTIAPPREGTPSDPIQAADILPYLPSLITASRNEMALQSQTTYLRRQLILANEETNRTMQRLAGESYLVPPNSTGMAAWAQAAADAGRKTEMAVAEHSAGGSEALKTAAEVLKQIQERRAALDALRVVV